MRPCLWPPDGIRAFPGRAVWPVDDHAFDSLAPGATYGGEDRVRAGKQVAAFQADEEAESRHRVDRVAAVEARIDELVFLEQEQERTFADIAFGERLENRGLANVAPILF